MTARFTRDNDLEKAGTVVLVARNEPIESLFGALKGQGKGGKVSLADMNPASLDESER